MLNKVILMGRLTADPELRQTTSGISSCRFSIAVDRNYKSKNSSEKQTDFINVQAWRQTAEFINKYFSKGKMIVIEGELQNNNYESNGVKHYSFIVNANTVLFGGDKKDDNVQQSNMVNTQQVNNVPQTDDSLIGGLDDFEEILSDGEVPF